MATNDQVDRAVLVALHKFQKSGTNALTRYGVRHAVSASNREVDNAIKRLHRRGDIGKFGQGWVITLSGTEKLFPMPV